MASAVGVMEQYSPLPYGDGKLGERMQFGALGSTVQGPEVMVKKVGGGGDGGGGAGGEGGEGGGEGGEGGGDGGDGYEHTRQL
jgi:hypothetical protein